MTRAAADPETDLASSFAVRFTSELLPNEREEIERAVALAASEILRSARFARMLVERAGVHVEVRVWLESDGRMPQVAVWWEPIERAFYAPIVDEGRSLGEVRFERLPMADHLAG